jgi:hypothetical protein
MKQRSVLTFAVLFLTTIILSGCPNAFDPLDSATSDEQILSAARAEFDKGNLTEARELYQKLGNNDAAESEVAFVDLNNAGVTMSTLVSAVRISSGETVGSILTNLSEAIAKSSGDASTKRTYLQSAYARVGGIESQQVRGFVRFLVGLSIAAEILAENGGVSGDLTLNKEDIVTTPASCSSTVTCATSSACDIASSSGLVIGSATTAESAKYLSSTETDIDISTASYVAMTNAILGATTGLTEMGVDSGDAKTLSDSLNSYAENLSANPTTAYTRCYLSALINTVGVGR